MIWDLKLQRRYPSSDFVLDVELASNSARLVLVGPSGAGKSQTLAMIAGLARPDAGHIRLANACWLDGQRQTPARARRCGVVPQDYALFPHLSVAQNVAFARTRGWRNPARIDDVTQHWLARTGLTALAQRRPAELSGGQRQRVALARALAMEPAVLLLDEPFAALDAALRQQLRDELATLLEDIRLPTLLITHDADDVAQFGGEVHTLLAGKIQSR
ncbi:sulfate/molybdate ABC transporter ATP-binding protein [Chitinibacteraceae bacterium HSL-7]